MGLMNSKVSELDFPNGMSFPQHVDKYIVDSNQAGNVYVVVFKNGYLDKKLCHHAIVVDVAGSSNETYLSGVTIHLTGTAATRIAEFRVEDYRYNRKQIHEAIFVGRLQSSQSILRLWALDL
jgi:hypothetical protein